MSLGLRVALGDDVSAEVTGDIAGALLKRC
jgi:hypothetical protein